MITTTFKYEKAIVHIHDPAETPEQKAKQRERIEKACIRFWKEVNR